MQLCSSRLRFRFRRRDTAFASRGFFHAARSYALRGIASRCETLQAGMGSVDPSYHRFTLRFGFLFFLSFVFFVFCFPSPLSAAPPQASSFFHSILFVLKPSSVCVGGHVSSSISSCSLRVAPIFLHLSRSPRVIALPTRALPTCCARDPPYNSRRINYPIPGSRESARGTLAARPVGKAGRSFRRSSRSFFRRSVPVSFSHLAADLLD